MVGASVVMTTYLSSAMTAGVKQPSLEKCMSKPLQQVLAEAGQRAAQWSVDTGDCLFCNVDNAPNGQSHEPHCTFYYTTKEDLKAYLKTLPELDDEP